MSEPAAVFVVGSPRSGTTFLGGALGAVPGFVDAGELLAAQIPDFLRRRSAVASEVIRQGLAAEGFDLAPGSTRPVIHAPEMVFLVPALLRMGADVVVIHLIRDGRDVVSSLLQLGWLAARPPVQSAERSLNQEWKWGNSARFWTEPERTGEFEAVSEARRAAWVWRRHVTTGLTHVGSGTRTATVRYEDMCADPLATARQLTPLLGGSTGELAEVLVSAGSTSVGRWRRDLDRTQLDDVYREAGELFRVLRFDSLPAVFDPDLAAAVVVLERQGCRLGLERSERVGREGGTSRT